MTDTDNRDRDSIHGRVERAKEAALSAHNDNPSVADELAEATGGISGVLVGAGIGSAAGPIGTVIGGIAGALGGWWAGRAVAEAASSLTREDEAHFRGHFDSQRKRPADRAYDDVRAAYYLGQIASHNPNFIARQFTEVEPELERGWSSYADKYGTWTTVRNYAAEGFSRGQSKLDEAARRARAQQEGRTDGELDDRRS
jgi:HEAT repeat protein